MQFFLNLLTFFADGDTTDTTIYWMIGLVVLLGAFMFYSSFRNKKKNAAMTEMKNKLAVGDKVQTIGGIIGIITEVNKLENTITISTGTSTLVFSNQAVYGFGFFDKPTKGQSNPPAKTINAEEKPAELNSVDAPNPDFLDAPNRDFIDAPRAESQAKPVKKSKKSGGSDTAKFE